MSIRDVAIDMEEVEADRRRNERARREFLDYYAEWLRHKALREPGTAGDANALAPRRRKGK